jgi:hypothetical protein
MFGQSIGDAPSVSAQVLRERLNGGACGLEQALVLRLFITSTTQVRISTAHITAAKH